MPADGLDGSQAGAAVASDVDDAAGYRIWLYNEDGDDRSVALDSPLPDPGDREVLWADVDLECADGVERLWEHLGVERLVDAVQIQGRPTFTRQAGVLQITVTALGAGPRFEPMPLHCLVGPNWVVTLHNGELDLVDEFNRPFHGDTRLGALNGPRFLSLVLDWQVSAYFAVIEQVQAEIDELDRQVLTRRPDDERDLLDRLIDLRSRVGKLRTILSRHRPVLSLLGHPESGAVVGTEAGEVYRPVAERLQQALDELGTVREMLVGSFDVFMTRTAQATNDVMKRLTIVSVLLLPAGVIAGVMGMNFQVGLFNHAWVFWVVLAAMVGLGGATLYLAARRGWL